MLVKTGAEPRCGRQGFRQRQFSYLFVLLFIVLHCKPAPPMREVEVVTYGPIAKAVRQYKSLLSYHHVIDHIFVLSIHNPNASIVKLTKLKLSYDYHGSKYEDSIDLEGKPLLLQAGKTITIGIRRSLDDSFARTPWIGKMAAKALRDEKEIHIGMFGSLSYDFTNTSGGHFAKRFNEGSLDLNKLSKVDIWL